MRTRTATVAETARHAALAAPLFAESRALRAAGKSYGPAADDLNARIERMMNDNNFVMTARGLRVITKR